MRGLDARHLLRTELVAPGTRLAAAKELPARPLRRFAKALVPLLLAQFGKIGIADREGFVLIARGPAGEIERRAENRESVRLHVLVADEMHGNVVLIEPARHMAAPPRQLLTKLIMQTARFCAEASLPVRGHFWARLQAQWHRLLTCRAIT
jgi:hypothetical protein